MTKPKTFTELYLEGKQVQRVVFASSLPLCSGCEEPWCPEHELHYHECDCIGPTQDDVAYASSGLIGIRRDEC